MFQTIWFFIKLSALSFFAIWLAMQKGEVSLDLMGYSISTQAGVFLLFILVCFFIFITLYRFIRGILSAPKRFVAYSQASQRKKSFRALTRGLVAVAAGDAKQATHYSKKTKNLWSDLPGLPLLLEAQAAQLRGEDGFAQNRFERMLADKDAAFLGVRGLMNEAIKIGDYARALDFARSAEKQHPKKPWVIKCVYALEIKNRKWRDALRTNQKASKLKVYDNEKLISDRIAIYLHHYDKAVLTNQKNIAVNEIEKAYKLNPYFIPTVSRYCRFLLDIGKKKRAIRYLEKAWERNPHPELADLWIDMAPEIKGNKSDKNQKKLLSWGERLIALNSKSEQGYIVAARLAMDLGLWGEARAHLMMAEKICPSAQVYRLQAIVEQNSTHNEDSMHDLMERASQALPDKAWICQETGIIYDHWSAIAKPHGAFNSIVWDVPGARVSHRGNDILQPQESAYLLDPVA